MTPAEAIAGSRLIIFDLFHTLVSFKSDGTPGTSTSELLGLPENDWNHLLWEHSDRRLRHDHSDDEAIIRELIRQHSPDMPDSRIALAAAARAERFRECLANPPEKRVAVIRELHARGHKLVLLSNADSMERRGWSSSPFAPYFTAAFFSCDTGHVKPEPTCYQMALDSCAVSPERAVFVGDGGSGELRGAKECGITTIMTTEIIGKFWPEMVDQRKIDADHVIADLSELL